MYKRPVLLLELVISLILFGFIMAILFSSYREMSLAKSMLQKDREAILARQKLQLRLSQIFLHLESMELLKDEPCLLKYDNGVDLQPEFRGSLEAMLYIDRGRLAFVSWSEKGEGRKEILYEKASQFSFRFFDSNKGDWSETYPDPKPFMIKMKIDDLELPFFL